MRVNFFLGPICFFRMTLLFIYGGNDEAVRYLKAFNYQLKLVNGLIEILVKMVQVRQYDLINQQPGNLA